MGSLSNVHIMLHSFNWSSILYWHSNMGMWFTNNYDDSSVFKKVA